MSSRRKFLVVADDTAEFQTALRFACRRARSTGGYVAILRVITPAVFEHWSGVREEIARQQRQEAEALLQLSAEYVQAETGLPPEFLILEADSTRAALKQVLSEDPEIKIMVLAAGVGRGGPGPLVGAIAKDGVRFGSRKVPITIVPGDLTDDEIADLA
jgi:nucleotide-binding universal stress UspA family protein